MACSPTPTEAVRIAATLLSPIMPASASEILRRLGDERPLSERRFDTDAAWRSTGERQILNAGALWPRIEAEKLGVTVTEEKKESGARVQRVQRVHRVHQVHRRLKRDRAPAHPLHPPHPLHPLHPSHPLHPLHPL